MCISLGVCIVESGSRHESVHGSRAGSQDGKDVESGESSALGVRGK